jgi:hypothetical protein
MHSEMSVDMHLTVDKDTQFTTVFAFWNDHLTLQEEPKIFEPRVRAYWLTDIFIVGGHVSAEDLRWFW